MDCVTRPNSLIYALIAFCCWLFPVAASAVVPTQNIQSDFTKLEQFQVGYFVDKTEKMSLSDIEKQHFTTSSNAITLGVTSKTTWVKIKLKNTSITPIKVFLHDPYAYHNHLLELYEVVDGKLTRKRVLDMNRKEIQQWMFHGTSIFDIELPPQQDKTLFIKNLAFSSQWFSFNLYNANQSKRALIGQHSDISLIIGMLLALIIYNFLLFFSSRLKEHLFYACYLIFGGCWVAFSNGLLAGWFNIFGVHALDWNLSLGAMPICLLLFMANIFETKKKYPIEHWALLATILMLVVSTFYSLFDVITALKYSSTIAAIMMVVSLSVALSMVIRKHPISLLFLTGHVFFVAFSTLEVFFYKGKVEFNYLNTHGVAIGIILEAIMLSLIIAYRVRSLEKLKATQAELQLLASTDPLTQLLNRRSLGLEASKLLSQDKQTQFPLSVAMLDIDLFKNINDTYGHTLGDQVIVQVANVLRDQCRRQDIIARYGGEEFVILMPKTELEHAHSLAERIRQTFEKVSIQNDQHQTINVTLSVGISEVDPKTADLQAAIDRADKALYEAKHSGRNLSLLYAG
ncbi:diguanylate cyclase [Marinomonas sp. TI.3.20]|uniref:sensor domain-containing diguanylate cyclase n=1 Tax=Marinomonas sp. TI.3.20 TaxID=3121296 RepID=UPI0031200670